MGTYFSGKIYKNFGSLAPALWFGGLSAGQSGVLGVIDAWAGADVSSVDATDAVTVLIGGMTTVVNFQNGDTSWGAVANRINTVTSTTIASAPDDEFLRLMNAWVGVTAISDATFAKIGLPILTRRPGDIAASSIKLGISLNDATPLDMVSQPIAVPDGANTVGIWPTLTNVTDVAGGFSLSLAWANGSDESVPYLGLGEMAIDPVLTGDTVAGPTLVNDIYWQAVRMNVGNSGAKKRMPIIADVPPHATHLFLIPNQSIWSSTPSKNPPTFSARVGFSSR